MFATIQSLLPNELYHEAIIFKEAKDYDNYIIHLTMAANLNHQLAIDLLCNDYRNEQTHRKQNYTNTLNFYETTLEYGFSANYLAWMYNVGKGVSQDYKKAIELYQIAIEKGNSGAMNGLGYMYDEGSGVTKDYDQAKKLYLMAIEKENSSAMNNLGLMYEEGRGVTQDYDQAIKLYLMAIEKENSAAINNLGVLYDEGRGVTQDYNKAINLYKMAIEKGNTTAINNFALMCQTGKGISKDVHQAIKLFHIAIEKDNSTAMFNLGYLYEKGVHVKQDYNLMKKYYLMAINNGNSNSKICLKEYYMKNLNDLSIIDLYDNKYFHDAAKDVINAMFQNNLCLPGQYKQQFANLKFDDAINETVKTKQNILKKTNIWPSNYDSKFLKEYDELLSISSLTDKPLTRDVILYIAGCLFV